MLDRVRRGAGYARAAARSASRRRRSSATTWRASPSACPSATRASGSRSSGAVDRCVRHAAHHHALGSVEDLGIALLEDCAAARVRARLEHGDQAATGGAGAEDRDSNRDFGDVR